MIQVLKSNGKLYTTWLIMTVLILIGVATTGFLSVAAMAMFALFLLSSPVNDSCALLFGLLPFANVFKYQAGVTSFFTVCELLLVLVALIKRARIKTTVVVSILVLAAYMVMMGSGTLNGLLIVKIVLGFLFFYLMTSCAKKEDTVNAAYLLASSTSLMMLLSMNDTYFSFVRGFLLDLDYVLDSTGHASSVMRMGGFLGDPNYCGALIIITVAFLCVLYYYKRIKAEFWVFLAFLIPLGFFTYSKSYFLCISVLVLFLIVFVLFPKHKEWGFVSTFAVLIIAVMALSGKIEVFNVILKRFTGGNILSGRMELNRLYLSYIWNHPSVLFFGEGIAVDRIIGAPNNVHNIYIESLFKLGIMGSLVYIGTLLACVGSHKARHTKSKVVDYLPLLFFAVSFYALAGITMYELPFYLSIAVLAKNFESLNDRGKMEKGLQGGKNHETV
ncbi:MAG: O-antigen ligase family protein [Clostridia bacterium]|nr:O-antigen ligase family protein [Clostridia bacterium]